MEELLRSGQDDHAAGRQRSIRDVISVSQAAECVGFDDEAPSVEQSQLEELHICVKAEGSENKADARDVL